MPPDTAPTTSAIPSHLAAFPWYAPHLAFLRTQGLTPRHDPGDASPRRASLRRADLFGVDLHGADLRDILLTNADLRRADLSGVDFTYADLSGVNLRGANLTGADLWHTVLSNDKLPDNVRGGEDGGYRWVAVAQADGVHLRYGCEWHSLEWWREQTYALSVKHGHDPEHWDIGPAVVIAAAEELAKLYPVDTAAAD